MDTTTKAYMRKITVFTAFLIFSITHIAGYSTNIDSTIGELPLIAVGPSKIISLNNEAILTVNGQHIVFDAQTITPNDSIQAGDYLAVYGETIEPGLSLATEVLLIDESYVEGASITFLRAIIDRASSDGVVYSNASVIDYTGTLHIDDLAQVGPGLIVEVSGVSYGNLLVADEGHLLDGYESSTVAQETHNSLDSIIKGQRGSSLRGQRGSSLRGQRGSSLRGQRGSSIR
jgi:hypothetical protein